MLYADNEGEMISLSCDDELLEALGHVVDGVFRLYVELADSRHSSSLHQFRPHQNFIPALSALLAGLHANSGGPGGGPCGSGEPDLAGCCTGGGGRSGEETEHAKDEAEENCQTKGPEFRQLIAETANTFLKPFG